MQNERPEGFHYEPECISEHDEKTLIDRISDIELREVKFHGRTARRRVAHFGWLYHYDGRQIEPGSPVPDFLLPVRAKAAKLAGVDSQTLAEVLVTEYRPAAAIGWHRDAPAFGFVVAASLAGSCRLRLRRGKAAPYEIRSLTVEPRSAYVLKGAARWSWLHRIPPMEELRYSITFRTCDP